MSRMVPSGLVLALAILAPLLAAAPSHVRAQVAVPATFYGSVSIDGAPVPDGTEVRAHINGLDCTQQSAGHRGTVTEDGVSQYSVEVMHESQQAGCGRDDAPVQFTVAGQVAAPEAVWRSGPQQLDLEVSSGSTPDEPGSENSARQTTRTKTPGSTAPAAAVHTATSPADTPADTTASDAVAQSATSTPEAVTATADDNDVDGGDGVSVWLIIAIIPLVVAGLIAGWMLGGRRRLS